MKVKMEEIVATLLAAYAVVAFPPGQLLLTAILSIAAYVFTESTYSVVGVLFIMSLLQILKKGLTPIIDSNTYGAIGGPRGGSVVGSEGFQTKDPISIHQRPVENKRIQSSSDVQGVLEMPSILNSLQISKIDPTEEGSSMNTLPAIVGGSQKILTPAEGFVPNVPSPDMGSPRTNRYVQEDPDDNAVLTALSKRLPSENIPEQMQSKSKALI